MNTATDHQIRKYYIGLAVIGIFTVAVMLYTVIQGASTKQDRVTNRRAIEIARELNSYVAENQSIPESLNEAGISDVPSTISYKKDSETQYTFCTTYKQASGGNATPDLLSGSAIRSGAERENRQSLFDDDMYPSSGLYIYSTYEKGENCKKVKPYLRSTSSNPSSRFSPGSGSSGSPTSRSSTSGTGGLASARDTERVTDINNVYQKLEEFYNENNYYPQTVTITTLKGMDAKHLIDPNGRTMQMANPVSSLSAMNNYPAPSATAANYVYIPYKCSANRCSGYMLKSYIEAPTGITQNPYTKVGLNN